MEITIRVNNAAGSGRLSVYTEANEFVFAANFGPTDAIKNQWDAVEIAKAAIAKYNEIETQNHKSETT